MVRTGLTTKIMHCLASEDDDVRYWAILCTHEAAGQGKDYFKGILYHDLLTIHCTYTVVLNLSS
jgi:hypothetical protein